MLTTVHRWLLIDALMHSAGCTIEDTRTNTVKIPRASRGRCAILSVRKYLLQCCLPNSLDTLQHTRADGPDHKLARMMTKDAMELDNEKYVNLQLVKVVSQLMRDPENDRKIDFKQNLCRFKTIRADNSSGTLETSFSL